MKEKKEISPSKSEIEITLIGPGYGESVVIHVGNNQWVVIDSCIDFAHDICAPLKYLISINVDPANVILIIATHWHDDHVKGLSTLVEACPNASFCCSSAFSTAEFLAYITSFESDCPIKFGSGASELNKTLEILKSRKNAPPPKHAVCNKRLLQKKPEDLGHPFVCEIWSISPSEAEIQKFLLSIKNDIPLINENRYRASSTNNSSVVIQVVIGELIILLGADLEETSNPNTGWSVIVESTEKPIGKAKVFKVPHHGSITAHSDKVWTDLVEDKALAILTPFNRGRKKLPAPEDIDRIKSFTTQGYITTPFRSNKLPKRDSLVEKEIIRTVGKLRPIIQKTGMIRLRKDLNISNFEWNIELFDGACHLSNLPSNDQ